MMRLRNGHEVRQVVFLHTGTDSMVGPYTQTDLLSHCDTADSPLATHLSSCPYFMKDEVLGRNEGIRLINVRIE